MNPLKTYQGLPRSVYVLFLAQVINRLGDFVAPFLTLFLTKQLGMSNSAAGAAVMITVLVSIPGAFAGGKIADHFGRKKSYILFQTMAGVWILLCTFTSEPWVITGLVSLAAFFNGGVRPIMTAIMTDVMTPEQRKSGFSLTYLGINVGVAIGPILAGFLFNHYLFMIFIGDALTTFFAVIMVAMNIKESLPEHCQKVPDKSNAHTDTAVDSDRANEQHEEGNILTVLLKRPQIMFFLLFHVFNAAAYTQHNFSLPLMLNQVFGDAGPRNFGFIMSLNAITVLAMTAIITTVTHKNRPIVNMCLGGLTYVIGFGMIGMIRSLPLFWLSTFVWTLGEILIVTNFGVYIANNTPQNFRARFSAVTSLSWAGGSVLGTYFMGMYIDAVGIVHIWPVVAMLAGVGTLGMAWLAYGRKERG